MLAWIIDKLFGISRETFLRCRVIPALATDQYTTARCSFCWGNWGQFHPPVRILPCNHVFGQDCVETWAKGPVGNLCPICRTQLFREPLRETLKTWALEAFIRMAVVVDDLIPAAKRFWNRRHPLVRLAAQVAAVAIDPFCLIAKVYYGCHLSNIAQMVYVHVAAVAMHPSCWIAKGRYSCQLSGISPLYSPMIPCSYIVQAVIFNGDAVSAVLLTSLSLSFLIYMISAYTAFILEGYLFWEWQPFKATWKKLGIFMMQFATQFPLAFVVEECIVGHSGLYGGQIVAEGALLAISYGAAALLRVGLCSSLWPLASEG